MSVPADDVNQIKNASSQGSNVWRNQAESVVCVIRPTLDLSLNGVKDSGTIVLAAVWK